MGWQMWVEFSNLKGKVDHNSSIDFTLREWGFVIYSDSSKLGLGCVLMQNGKVMAYASR